MVIPEIHLTTVTLNRHLHHNMKKTLAILAHVELTQNVTMESARAYQNIKETLIEDADLNAF